MKLNRIYRTFKLINVLSLLAGYAFLLEKGRQINKKRFISKFSGVLLCYRSFLILFMISSMIFVMYSQTSDTRRTKHLHDIHVFQMTITITTGIMNLVASAYKLAKNVDIILNKMAVQDNLMKVNDKMNLVYRRALRKFEIVSIFIFVMLVFLYY